MMGVLFWFPFLVLYLGVIFILTQKSLGIFHESSWTSTNYKGEPIIQSFGIHFVVHYILFLILYYYCGLLTYSPNFISFESFMFVILMFVLTILGWIDDHYGTKDIKGFQGHFKEFFFHLRITTGLLKAILGTLVALIISFFVSMTSLEWFFQTAVIIFSIHFFNLLDVRPGRTIKGFWIFLLLILPFFAMHDLLIYVVPIILSTAIIFHFDRRRVAMLGDTGSNVLGGVFGFYLVAFTPFKVQLMFLFLFLALSLLAEKYSFTSYIKKTPWLSKLDNWGIVNSTD
jgi:UDP-GlcNAc:undecaprenyl-phosphate GlcNAc-1-phosphate transferase